MLPRALVEADANDTDLSSDTSPTSLIAATLTAPSETRQHVPRFVTLSQLLLSLDQHAGEW
jgi:hypothetical protein